MARRNKMPLATSVAIRLVVVNTILIHINLKKMETFMLVLIYICMYVYESLLGILINIQTYIFLIIQNNLNVLHLLYQLMLILIGLNIHIKIYEETNCIMFIKITRKKLYVCNCIVSFPIYCRMD